MLSHWWSHPVVRAVLLLTALCALATAGYMAIEGWRFGDALFMAVVVLSTVGLGEPHALSPAGRAFTTGLIIAGVTIAAYLISALGQYVTGGVLTGAFRTRRLQRIVNGLSDHYIVCGYGRVGRQVVADLRRRGCKVVVVESKEALAVAGTDPAPMIFGDATNDSVLSRAGIARARGLVAGTGSDPTNLVITLSARALNADLTIVARASEAAAGPKLLRAGATHVVSPYAMGGRRIASELLSPGVTAFLDTVMHEDELDLWLEEATVSSESPLAGRTINDAVPHAVPQSAGRVNLIALRRADGAFVTNPASDVRLVPGDTLLAVGPQDAVQQLGARASGRPARMTKPPARGRTRRPSGTP